MRLSFSHQSYSSNWKSSHSPGTPFKTYCPWDVSTFPEPTTRSLTVGETSPSPALACSITRAAMCRAMPLSSSSRTGDRLLGVSIEDARLALQSLACLHAAWWQVDPATLPELAVLVDNSPDSQDLVDQLCQQARPRLLVSANLEIPDDIRHLGKHLLDRTAAAEALLDDSPRTLVHGDFRLENMLFGTRNGLPVCWVIDWEDVALSNGMLDVAWFLGGCLPEQMSDREPELLQSYHQDLMQGGVIGYSWAQCLHDYRCAMFSSLIQAVLTVASLHMDDNTNRRLADALTRRFFHACRRLCLVDLLPL